ncbi:dephospho-CoA kinase [Cohnella rhizosphaerae]|uniref:Dephospho-CoA kinase n=1 Tax=Cohnella rhizosphaerae TaxID=1457232 RepID=A0A9X4KNF2_9BACL|nr:dephospho-CoA kinase [Cohnella rhizosphaerae]MDG0808236.1 dephospho-CoA kinase [Cohnella rhizosphaerae]
MNIGLTGGIATGKSTVARMLVARGAALVDADRIAREIVEPGQAALVRIAERFGDRVIQADGSLDRRMLGTIVFADAEERKALEAITHPAIRELMRERVAALEAERPDRLVVADIPLLYESGLQHVYEGVMVAYVPREVQRTRLIGRDGLSPEEADKRIGAQMDIEEKRRLADYVIDNSGTVAETEAQLDRFWRSLRSGPVTL